MYSLDSPVMKICRGGSWSPTTTVTPELPEPLAKLYKTNLPPRQNQYESVSYTSTFRGVIPADVRKAIAEALPLFATNYTGRAKKLAGGKQSNIFIVAEASWATKTVIHKPDPLVVGWDGNRLRLIAHFDLTNLERYIKNEI